MIDLFVNKNEQRDIPEPSQITLGLERGLLRNSFALSSRFLNRKMRGNQPSEEEYNKSIYPQHGIEYSPDMTWDDYDVVRKENYINKKTSGYTGLIGELGAEFLDPVNYLPIPFLSSAKLATRVAAGATSIGALEASRERVYQGERESFGLEPETDNILYAGLGGAAAGGLIGTIAKIFSRKVDEIPRDEPVPVTRQTEEPSMKEELGLEEEVPPPRADEVPEEVPPRPDEFVDEAIEEPTPPRTEEEVPPPRPPEEARPVGGTKDSRKYWQDYIKKEMDEIEQAKQTGDMSISPDQTGLTSIHFPRNYTGGPIGPTRRGPWTYRTEQLLPRATPPNITLIEDLPRYARPDISADINTFEDAVKAAYDSYTSRPSTLNPYPLELESHAQIIRDRDPALVERFEKGEISGQELANEIEFNDADLWYEYTRARMASAALPKKNRTANELYEELKSAEDFYEIESIQKQIDELETKTLREEAVTDEVSSHYNNIRENYLRLRECIK